MKPKQILFIFLVFPFVFMFCKKNENTANVFSVVEDSILQNNCNKLFIDLWYNHENQNVDHENGISFSPNDDNLFKGYENAKVIVDYCINYGFSTIDRYQYEVIIVDSMLFLSFDSEETDNFHKIKFSDKRELKLGEVKRISSILNKYPIEQIKLYTPNYTGSCSCQEVFIVKYKGKYVQGGFCYSPCYESEEQFKIDSVLLVEKSATIKGNTTALRSEILKFFPNLNLLLKKAKK
ncbi:MAG: hypothetical protein V2A54_00130 [Bacteroidota bacterium]